MRYSGLLSFLLLGWLSAQALASVFVYTGPDGEKIISDYPLNEDGYQLISEKTSLRNVGRIMANRPSNPARENPAYLKTTIDKASIRYGIDPALVEAVIQTESSFNPVALSKKGAAGLMQLTDETASHYRVFDSMSIEENIDAGAKHLSKLLKRYKGELPLVLAAYNAGETAVAKYHGVPPYPETKRYIKKVLTSYRQYWQSRYGTRAYPYQNLM